MNSDKTRVSKMDTNFLEINFQHLWRTTVENFNGINFRVRKDSNRRHDLVFLSSWLHDSRIKAIREVDFHESQKLIIEIERDRWEAYRSEAPMLTSIDSIIVLEMLSSWTDEGLQTIDFIQMNEVLLRSGTSASLEFFDADYRKLQVNMDVDDYSISLIDQSADKSKA